ncbi:glycosyltransferase [Singulisphaera acidiphila]|uniref:Glycosyl transferase n=1 Tax=Singulisphaera acidiphila (strain ATCC BAA-1392 / DSM 18658 / VKM B-2454 / MOB10) TaxID=886293 RepID=L0D9W9_SINAD|nr:glycosyltransferase family 2 protein [Singulisphaera acidiphila]AGA25421.1 glycosyl transferase [Singulisphaera acidiphila DSM 18658]
MLILLFLCLVSSFLSIVVGVQFAAALRRISWNPPGEGSIHEAKLSVILPARNEEEDIASAVQSVLNQVGVDIEVVVVNDHSSDRTGAIVDSLATTDTRLKIMHNPALPPGWLGKSNAMQQAAALASGDYLVFTDADVLHDPRSMATALAEMERSRLDFFSLFPRIHCLSVWENVLAPVFVGGMVQYATTGIEVGNSRDAVAAGAFMMVRSEAFRAVGGFESIRGEMFDDVSLARLLKASGYRLGFRAAPQLLQVRLFKGNRHAFWGMTKNILEVLGGRLWLAPFVMLLPVFVFWTPLVAGAVGVIQGNGLLVAVAVATYLVQYSLLWLGRSLFSFHPAKVLFFPLVAIVVASCLIRALYYQTFKGAVRWRGRTVQVRGLSPSQVAIMSESAIDES